MPARCASAKAPPPAPARISQAAFGRLPDGSTAQLFTLRNADGMEVKITNYGGIVTSIKVPDRHGVLGDVVLGYDSLDGYLASTPYFGAIVGRYANRIAKGRFTLDGATYKLAVNNGPNSLHGGLRGFDKALWKARVANTKAGPALELSYLSRDMEEGYPGNLRVTARYTLTPDDSLRLELTARTDRATVVNLTQHSYFNLAGKGTILDDRVFIDADRFTPVDATQIPTGELRRVDGTPFDFRKPTAVGARIGDADEQLKFGGGYDHNYVLNKKPGELKLAARVTDPSSGRVLEVSTTEPGLQFYTGNSLDGTITGKGGWTYQRRDALCLEAQHFPDSPNHPDFPSTVLRPGQVYRNMIVFHFAAR